jgi:HEAT repeat protein
VVSLASAQVKVAAAQDSAMATLAAVGKPAIEELTSLLLDTSTVEPLRETAAADLGQIGNPEAAAALESSASPSPPNPELRRVCLTSLASIVLTSVPNVTGIPAAKAPISGPRLVAQAKAEAPVLIASVLNTNDDSFARAREALALGRLATPAAINALVQTLASYDIRLASAAQSGIESVGDPAVSALSRAVIDQNQQVRQGAALALGVIGTTPALVAIRPAFSDTAPSVREAAASGLGRSKNPASMPILMAHLGDPDGSVASAISNSLHELGNPAVDGLIAALGSKNTSGSIPFFASQALSSDGQMSVSALLAASTTGTTNQKVWIAVTLGTMHDPNVVSGLKDLSNDSNARVKWAARQALEQYEGDS